MYKIPLNKKVSRKDDFEKVVTRSFTTFTPPTEEIETSVEQFFKDYNRLFFEIPSNGEFNSHEELARRSSEISNFQTETTDIQPLLDEISNLREQLIEANLTIINLESNNQI